MAPLMYPPVLFFYPSGSWMYLISPPCVVLPSPGTTWELWCATCSSTGPRDRRMRGPELCPGSCPPWSKARGGTWPTRLRTLWASGGESTQNLWGEWVWKERAPPWVRTQRWTNPRWLQMAHLHLENVLESSVLLSSFRLSQKNMSKYKIISFSFFLFFVLHHDIPPAGKTLHKSNKGEAAAWSGQGWWSVPFCGCFLKTNPWKGHFYQEGIFNLANFTWR